MSVANTWRWLPDWSEPVNERLEWRTDVQQGYDGTEERYAMRAIPRRVWSWSMVLEGYERQKFEEEFYSAATADWLVPLWWDVQRASLSSSATTYTRATDPADRELPNGCYLVIADRNGAIGKGPVIRTTGIIGGVPSESFTWTGGLTRAFPRGRVYAARMAQVQVDSFEHITAGVTRYSIRAQAVADFAVSPVTVDQWPLRPNRAQPLSSQWELLRERVDFGGAWQYDVRRAKPLRGLETTYEYGTRFETYTLRQAFARLAGRYRAALLPSFQADLTATQPAGGANVFVRPIGWTTSSPNRIAVVTRSGDVHHRTVTSSVMVGADERLTVTPTLSFIQLANIRQVCWAWPARLASDAVEIVWTTPEVATVSIPWQEVAS